MAEYWDLECVGGPRDGEYLTLAEDQKWAKIGDRGWYKVTPFTELDTATQDEHPELSTIHLPVLKWTTQGPYLRPHTM